MSMRGTCVCDFLTWRVSWVKLIEPEQSTPTAHKSVTRGWDPPWPLLFPEKWIYDIHTLLIAYLFVLVQVTANFWQTWKEFEIRHGNEDTIREMLRIKRSVQATYNTQVNFMSSQMLKATTSSTGTGERAYCLADNDLILRTHREADDTWCCRLCKMRIKDKRMIFRTILFTASGCSQSQ